MNGALICAFVYTCVPYSQCDINPQNLSSTEMPCVHLAMMIESHFSLSAPLTTKPCLGNNYTAKMYGTIIAYSI